MYIFSTYCLWTVIIDKISFQDSDYWTFLLAKLKEHHPFLTINLTPQSFLNFFISLWILDWIAWTTLIGITNAYLSELKLTTCSNIRKVEWICSIALITSFPLHSTNINILPSGMRNIQSHFFIFCSVVKQPSIPFLSLLN